MPIIIWASNLITDSNDNMKSIKDAIFANTEIIHHEKAYQRSGLHL